MNLKKKTERINFVNNNCEINGDFKHLENKKRCYICNRSIANGYRTTYIIDKNNKPLHIYIGTKCITRHRKYLQTFIANKNKFKKKERKKKKLKIKMDKLTKECNSNFKESYCIPVVQCTKITKNLNTNTYIFRIDNHYQNPKHDELDNILKSMIPYGKKDNKEYYSIWYYDSNDTWYIRITSTNNKINLHYYYKLYMSIYDNNKFFTLNHITKRKVVRKAEVECYIADDSDDI